MNIPHNPDSEEFLHGWRAQERAFDEEKSGVSPADCGGEVAKYRLIARVLRTPRIDPLPEDFAARAAARIEAATVAIEDLLEIWLLRVLFAFLVAGGAVIGGKGLTSAYSRVSSLEYSGVGMGAGWILVIAACVGLSLALDYLRRGWRKSGNGTRIPRF